MHNSICTGLVPGPTVSQTLLCILYFHPLFASAWQVDSLSAEEWASCQTLAAIGAPFINSSLVACQPFDMTLHGRSSTGSAASNCLVHIATNQKKRKK